MMPLPLAGRASARYALAARIHQSRKDRSLFFPSNLFGDAGWDMLLTLYVEGQHHPMSAAELSRATIDVTMSSALRLQRRLVDLELVRRVADPLDGRRILIEMTDCGRRAMDAFLDHLMETHFAKPVAPAAVPQRECADAITTA